MRSFVIGCIVLFGMTETAFSDTKTPPKELTVDLGGGVKMELVLIPAGEFLMGSPDSDKDADQHEKPQHRVRITKPFYLGKYPVTQEQWEAVMGNNPSNLKGSKSPVENVTWNDCQQFLDKLNRREGNSVGEFRLPTQAQWEYACRAGSTTRYCFGDEESRLGEYAWYDANSARKTHSVGEKKPNGWGLYDMHGNVLEWCQDSDDGVHYAESPMDDPTGPAQVSNRVSRGGYWGGPARNCRSASRHGGWPGNRYIHVGLRAAMAKDKDLSRRIRAAKELAGAGAAAVPALIELLKDKNSEVREVAAGCLRQMSQARPEAKAAVPVLTESLKDPHGRVRCAAALALGEIGCNLAAVVPAITELLKDEDIYVRNTAAAVLGAIGPEARTAIPTLKHLHMAGALKEIGPAAAPALVELFKDKNAKVRRAAERGLLEIGPEAETAIPALVELLKDGDAEELLASEVLAKIGPAAVLAVTKSLQDNDRRVRNSAERALCRIAWRIGPEAKTAVPALTELLKDTDSRRTAAEALGRIGPEAKAAVPALTELLKDTDAAVQLHAALALLVIGPENSAAVVPLLAESLEGLDVEHISVDDMDRVLRTAFALAEMGRKGKPATALLTELLKSPLVPNERCRCRGFREDRSRGEGRHSGTTASAASIA